MLLDRGVGKSKDFDDLQEAEHPCASNTHTVWLLQETGAWNLECGSNMHSKLEQACQHKFRQVCRAEANTPMLTQRHRRCAQLRSRQTSRYYINLTRQAGVPQWAPYVTKSLTIYEAHSMPSNAHRNQWNPVRFGQFNHFFLTKSSEFQNRKCTTEVMMYNAQIHISVATFYKLTNKCDLYMK